jgi:hypothetical protein
MSSANATKPCELIDSESSSSDISEHESMHSEQVSKPVTTTRRTKKSDKSAKFSGFELLKLESFRTSFVKQIGRNLAKMAINNSYDRLKSVNFLIPGPSVGEDTQTTRHRSAGTKGDPSTDPRLRTVSAR